MLVRDTSTQTILSDVYNRLTLATFKIYTGIVLITQSNVATPLAMFVAINERGITSIISLLPFEKGKQEFQRNNKQTFPES